MDITTETVELCDCNGAATAASFRERGGELRATVEGVSALARLDLYELASDLEPFSGSEASKRVPLRFKPKT
jgi:hypothetical protein